MRVVEEGGVEGRATVAAYDWLAGCGGTSSGFSSSFCSSSSSLESKSLLEQSRETHHQQHHNTQLQCCNSSKNQVVLKVSIQNDASLSRCWKSAECRWPIFFKSQRIVVQQFNKNVWFRKLNGCNSNTLLLLQCKYFPLHMHTPVFLNKDTFASILRIHIIDVKIPVWGRHEQARKLLNPDEQSHTRGEWTCTDALHKKENTPVLLISCAALRGQGTDVLQAKHVESYSGEGSVLVHHVGHVGGQVSAGCSEHFAHICGPCGRLFVLTWRKQDGL